tara:strand:+ start:781 stop:1548 length:768 start_codon:yes stop_codon:yes gene_type:complete
MKTTVYTTDRQGTGAFDGGKITEIKPIDFPGGTSEAARIGPLFYWAWASSSGEGVIGMHPHQGFEIMSYVLVGEIGHTDTLDTKSRVGAGGAQVMQTGSGVSHQEEIYGQATEFFQIWFEPDLTEAIKREPTYSEHHHSDFPVVDENGVLRKLLIGNDAPVSLVADVQIEDVAINAGMSHEIELKAGRAIASVAIAGSGSWQTESGEVLLFQKSDFSVLETSKGASVVISASTFNELRLMVIDVPSAVSYDLYGE